jgi:hypothetical protein
MHHPEYGLPRIHLLGRSWIRARRRAEGSKDPGPVSSLWYDDAEVVGGIAFRDNDGNLHHVLSRRQLHRDLRPIP